jgi:hypothetical protein
MIAGFNPTGCGWIVLLLGLVFGSPGISTAIAAEPASTESAGGEAAPAVKQLQIQNTILLNQIKKLAAENDQLRQQSPDVDPDVMKAYSKARQRQYLYHAELEDANVQTLYAQKIASYVILILVFLVVVSGVLFSGFQLWKSVSIGVQSSTDFELSASKVRVTSSVVGIVVLTISLVFLYIYTHEVFQIRPIDTPPETQADKPSASLN